MKYVIAVRIILQAIPLLTALVRLAEENWPESGQGRVKLAWVRNKLESFYVTGDRAAAAFETAWPTIENRINTIVVAFNASGVFKK